MHPKQNKFAQGDDRLPKHCDAVRSNERLSIATAHTHHSHRVASEPVASQVFFGVDEQCVRWHAVAERVDENAARCTERTPSTLPSTPH